MRSEFYRHLVWVIIFIVESTRTRKVVAQQVVHLNIKQHLDIFKKFRYYLIAFELEQPCAWPPPGPAVYYQGVGATASNLSTMIVLFINILLDTNKIFIVCNQPRT